MKFLMAGTGTALPALRLDSSSIDQEFNKPSGWLQKLCGVETRYVCKSETQDELAMQAAKNALSAAKLNASNIDFVIFAAAVSKQPIPSTAPLIARQLGIPNGFCTAFDVNSTCLSFLSALDVAINMINNGRYKCALVVSSELASRALPWKTDPSTAGLFGDGAAAAVILPPSTTKHSSTVKATHFEIYHDGYEFCQLAAGGTGIDFHADPENFQANALFNMNGGSLFKLSAKHFPSFINRLLDQAKWRKEDVDFVIPHQASPLALSHLINRCGFAKNKVINIVAEYGNQIAASIPTALHIAREQGHVKEGSKILLLGTSAGVSFGGMAIEV